MKKLIAMGLTVIMTAVAVCGCGSSDSGNDAKKSDSQTKQQAVKVIDVDLTSEEYAFGVDKNKPELLTQVNEFIKEIKDKGTFDEICHKYIGGGNPTPVKELVIQNMEFDSVCLSVGQHKSDVAMAGLTVKEDRKKYVNFSDTYYNAAQRLIVKGDSTEFDSCKDKAAIEKILKTKDKSVTIGVQNGTTGQFYCEGDKDWGFEGYKVTTTGYKNGSLAVQDLINGNINYVVIDSAPAKCITEAINKMQ